MKCSSTGPFWIPFATITKAHGVHGEVRAKPLRSNTYLPEATQQVRVVSQSGPPKILSLKSVRLANNAILISFDQITQREDAQKLSRAIIEVDTATLPQLADGELYLFELIDVNVVDETGVYIGVIVNFMENRNQEILVIHDINDQEKLLPLADDTIINFNRVEHSVRLRIPNGLWDL
ncbi:MAG: 16S rRNA processing protein RimM [Deltaproteobacteria bacterium]|nr:16S rRNA processing protein RimM [Deltaproteobacteria bacterium]